MKTSFSSVITPPAPKQCCKMLRRCLFVSNIEKGERGGYFSRSDRAEFALSKKGGNFNVSQQLLSMIVGAIYSSRQLLLQYLVQLVS